MLNKIAVLFLLCSMSLAAGAGEVFKWVDENGKIHYGDVLPDKYKQQAKKVDSAGPDVTDLQRMEAEARNAKEKKRAEALQKSREEKTEAQPDPAPAPAPQATNECEEQMSRYLASLACFDKFRNANARGAKPEGVEECQQVPQPQGCLPKPDSSDRPYLPGAP